MNRSLARKERYRKLLVSWFASRGEKVRVRVLAWQAFRHRSGAVYQLSDWDEKELEAGDRAVNLARAVRTDGKLFLCGFDTVHGAKRSEDRIIEAVVWSRGNETGDL